MKNYSLVKKNKILHIITSLGDGGAEGVLYRLIKTTQKNYLHEIITLTDDRKHEYYLKKLGIKIIRIKLPRGKLRLKNLKFLYNTLKKKNDYVIQTWLYHSDFLGGLFAKFSGNKKIIWNIRTSEIFISSIKLKTLLIIFFNAFLSWFIPKKIIICSANSIPRHLHVGFKNNFKVIHNGYDLNIYPKSKKKYKKKDFLLDANDFVVGNVARFNSVKNHLYLLDIFSKIYIRNRVPKLVLIGSGVDENNHTLKKKIKELKIENRVMLLGRKDDVINIYPIFDLFILPSESEGFPNVLAESMMNKNIVFSTNVGEVSHIIPNKKFILPLNNHLKSAKKINYYFNNTKKDKLNKDKIINERVIKNCFSLSEMSKKYQDIWKF